MTLRQRIRRFLGYEKTQVTEPSGVAFIRPRQSVEFDDTYMNGWHFLPRRIYPNFNAEDLIESKNLSYAQILAILPDLEPNLALALHNMTRLSASDYKISVFNAGNTEVINTKGQKIVETFLSGVNKHYGGLDNLIVQLNQAGYLQGAMSVEAVLDPTTKKVIDISPINPFSIHFLKPEGVDDIAPYQYQLKPRLDDPDHLVDGNYVEMNPLTFWYIPLDPAIGDPYGRSPATAAISDIFFNMQVMHDLRKVIHNQGYPRLNVTVMTDIIKKLAPDDVQNDEVRLMAFVTARINEITTSYNNLKPDDTFIHSDGVSIDMVGASSRNGMLDPSAILKAIEARIIRGLKQLPLLMGSNEGVTETHGTVQFTIFAKGIEALQKMVESIMEEVLELMLRMEGINADVDFEFDKIKTTDRLLDANAESMEIANEIQKVSQGWITNDEAAITITGTEAVGEPIEEKGSDEEAEDEQDLTAKPQPAPSTTVSVKGNSRQTRARARTVAGQQKRYGSLYRRFHSTVADHFDQLERAFPFDHLINQVVDLWPQSQTNLRAAKRVLKELETNAPVDQNSPVYNTITDLVGKFFDGEKAQNIMDNLSEEGAALLIEAYENYAQNVIIRLADKVPNFAYATFRLDDPGQKGLIEKRAEFFPMSSFETASRDISKTVMRGYADAKSTGDIATDLRAKFAELKTSRATLIANMELNYATSQGTLETMRRNGVQEKSWITVGDDRVRPDHQANMDEGPIPVNGTFSGTGDDAPPADFNCRCTLVEHVNDDWTPPANTWAGGMQ